MTYFALLSDADLVLRWQFNDTKSPFTPADCSGCRNHSTVNRTTWKTAAGPTTWLQRSLEEEGQTSGDQFFSNNSNDIIFDPASQSFSLCLWYFRGNTGNNRILYMRTSDGESRINLGTRNSADGRIGITVNSEGYGFATNAEWNHISFTWNHATSTLLGYLDGELASPIAVTPLSHEAFTSEFRFGTRVSGFPVDFRFAELLLFRRVLTAGEVANVYNGPPTVGGAAFPPFGNQGVFY